MDPFSFVSGNLRGWSSPDQDGEHAWHYRAPLYAALLRERSPALIGFQEFLETNHGDLESALPFHAWAMGRLCGTREYVPIYWDTRRFRSIRTESFWLNPWREIKAVGWDAQNERAVTCVELEDLETGNHLLVVNTHLDHLGEVARVRGARLILDFLEEWPQAMPIILMGDFNSSPYRPIRRTAFTPRTFGLFAVAGFMDAYRSVTGVWPPPATFHDYRGTEYVPDQHGTWYIDWPLTRNLRVLSAEIIRNPPGTHPVSDHYPVEAVVTYTGES
ncbi:MAG TPA: hypothetical protein VGR08_12890 [Thermomicrobiales bacterium]|nr:hypothetical protein [Thermomicrobiales bacterium]